MCVMLKKASSDYSPMQSDILELQELARKFCADRDWEQYHNPKELAIGLITESSELLEHFRFKTEKQMDEMFRDPAKKTAIAEEIADALYFILRFGQKYDIDLAAAVKDKIKKNELKYPIEKSKGLNKKYNEL